MARKFTFTTQVYDKKTDFPQTGDVDVIYIDASKNLAYRYDDTYQAISSSEVDIWGALGDLSKKGGGASWGTITGTLSNQTDLDAALRTKQSTLVAGTNLKYVNGFSLLGSGDLLTPMGVQALIKPQTGQYVSTMPFGVVGSLGAVTGVVNRLYVYPFIPSQDIAVQAMLINVITGFAGSFARIVYYVNTTLNGGDYPGAKAFESTSLDCSTTGLKTASISTQFNKGQIYWIGVHVSSAPGLLATVQSNMLSLGYNGAASNYCHLNQSTTFGSLPSNYGIGFPQSSTCPQVFLKMV